MPQCVTYTKSQKGKERFYKNAEVYSCIRLKKLKGKIKVLQYALPVPHEPSAINHKQV
jgi:hypothetical protein